MQGKKRYLVVALFLLIGLTTFSFAAPKEELKEKKTIKGTSEKIANDKKVNNSYTDALEAVEEAEENPTLETVETARIEIQRADDATVQQREELENRIEEVEESIDVAALVTELETLVSVKETIPTAETKYPNAETEVEKMDEGEVKDNLVTRLTRVSNIINDGGKPEYTGIQNNEVTNQDVTLVVTDDTKVTKTVKLNNEDAKFEDTFKAEGTYVVTLSDEAFNEEVVTFTIDKKAAKKNAVNANVNGYDNKEKEQYAINGKKVTAYITLSEELKEKPTFTFYANGKEIKKVTDEVVASASTNANYPYKYTAVLEINENLVAEDGDLTFTVTDIYDIAGNKTADITKLSVPNKTLTLDRTPNRVTFTTISTDNKNVEGKVYYVTEGDTITFRMGVREKFSENPVITIGGKEVTLEYVKYFVQPNHHEYRGTVKLDDTLVDGNLNYTISGSKDLAGNKGFYYQTNGKKVLQTITTKETTNGKSLVYDNNAPVAKEVLVLSKGTNHKYAKNGDTIRFLVRFNEEVKLTDDFVVVFNNTTKKLVRSGDKNQIEYIAEFKIAEDENALAEGPLTFEVKGFQDKLGNASTEVLTTANHYKYNGVTYDRTAPEFVAEQGYNENGDNPYVKVADTNTVSFKVYRKGTETPIHEFDSTTVGKSFKIGWHGGGMYTITATDAAGNTSSKEFEVYHTVDSLEDLKNAFKYGGKATITENVTLSEQVEIPEGVELVIDLQGNELKANTESEQKLIVNSGKLTIKNGTINNDGTSTGNLIENTKDGVLVLENIKTTDNATSGTATVLNNGKMTIIDSELSLPKETNKRNNVRNTGDLEIRNSSLTSWAKNAYSLYMTKGNLTIDDNSKIDVKNNGRGAIWIIGGNLTINNANITIPHSGTTYHAIYVADQPAGADINVTINGGNIIGYRSCICIEQYDNFDIKLAINGGTYNIDTVGKRKGPILLVAPKEGAQHKIEASVKGGTYLYKDRGAIDQYIAEGYRINAEGRIVKENAITTKAEMVDAIAKGGKFELETDLTLTDTSLKVAKNKDVEINLNGKTITARSTNSSASNAIEVLAGGNLKLTGNGKIEFTAGSPDTDWGEGGSKPYPGYASNTIVNRGTLVIDGPTIVNNTEYGGATYAVDAYAGSKLTLISGEISAPYNRAIRMFTSSETPSTDVTIKGGKVTGNIPLYVHVAGSNSSVAPTVNLNISGGEIGTIDGWSLYTYSYGNSFKNINVTITGGEFYGSVAFSGGKKVDKENVSITGGTFHSDLGRYLANDGWEDIEKPTK